MISKVETWMSYIAFFITIALLVGCTFEKSKEKKIDKVKLEVRENYCTFSDKDWELLSNIGFRGVMGSKEEAILSKKVIWPATDSYKLIPKTDWFHAFPKCPGETLDNIKIHKRIYVSLEGSVVGILRKSNLLIYKTPDKPTDVYIIEVNDFFIATFFRD